MSLLEYIISFVLGVVSSVVATQLYARIIIFMNKLPKLDIEGTWGEYIPKSVNRNYTIGRITFDRKKNIYAFDGTNYSNEGKAYCHFETVASHVDVENKRFYYIFSAHICGDFGKVYFGFGAVNLIVNNNILTPIDGHYFSANVDAEAMTHSMQRLENITYNRDREAGQSIRLIRRY